MSGLSTEHSRRTNGYVAITRGQLHSAARTKKVTLIGGGNITRVTRGVRVCIEGTHLTVNGRSQMTAVNGKRPNSLAVRHHNDVTAPQFDIVKYIYDSWNSVSRELDMSHNQSHGESQNYRNGQSSVTYYQEREPNPLLKDFEPFNLEAWWGQRVVQSITRNTNS